MTMGRSTPSRFMLKKLNPRLMGENGDGPGYGPGCHCQFYMDPKKLFAKAIS